MNFCQITAHEDRPTLSGDADPAGLSTKAGVNLVLLLPFRWSHQIKLE